MKNKRFKLKELVEGAICTLPDVMQSALSTDEFLRKIQEGTVQEIDSIIDQETNALTKSIWIKCVIADQVLQAQSNDYDLDPKLIYDLIFQCLTIIKEDLIIARIGSQGFLSIPLFRLDKGQKSFNLLRLHIWDSSLIKYINEEATKNFAIHSHQFHAHSWILSGRVSNTTFRVDSASSNSEHAHFDIKWKNELTNVNERQSIAVNTKQFIKVTELNHDEYSSGEKYEIDAGVYHKSGIDETKNINSTLFLFSSYKSRVPRSNVVGPANIQESEINRKREISALSLLNKLYQTINNDS